jgi:hypothetical protein
MTTNKMFGRVVAVGALSEPQPASTARYAKTAQPAHRKPPKPERRAEGVVAARPDAVTQIAAILNCYSPFS